MPLGCLPLSILPFKLSSVSSILCELNSKAASKVTEYTNMSHSDAMLPSHERISEMNQEVQDVHGIMKNNMDNLLERGGKLSDLDGRADDLNKSAAMVCLS